MARPIDGAVVPTRPGRPSLRWLLACTTWHSAPSGPTRSGRGVPYERSTIGRSLEQVGFIHCSFEEQVAATFDRFYAGRNDVVLLVIDPSRLAAEVRVEDLTDTGEAFPHLYGPLELDAVIDVRDYPG